MVGCSALLHGRGKGKMEQEDWRGEWGRRLPDARMGKEKGVFA
jgi:hypothetical protein